MAVSAVESILGVFPNENTDKSKKNQTYDLANTDVWTFAKSQSVGAYNGRTEP